jgi:hypothetical protein
MERPAAMTAEQTSYGLYPAAVTADVLNSVEHNIIHMKGTPNACLTKCNSLLHNVTLCFGHKSVASP